MKVNKRFVAIDNVCAWPQLRINDNQEIFMTGFNQPCHGKTEGDVVLWVSKDGGETFNYTGTPVVHEPTTNRMNHCSGFAHNGDFISIVSGYSNRPKEIIADDEAYRKVFYQSKTLQPIIARSSDGGETYTNIPLQFESDKSIIPFGEICKLKNNALICSIYLIGDKTTKSFLGENNLSAGVLISYDDGYIWEYYHEIDGGLNEVSLAVLEDRVVAVARTAEEQHLELYQSLDWGKTWTHHKQFSMINQIPASIIVLKDNRTLVTYGCRNNIKRISYRIGDQYGVSFSDPVILQVIDTEGDMGYPSTVQLNDGSLVTAYYTSRDSHHDRYHVGIIKWEL